MLPFKKGNNLKLELCRRFINLDIANLNFSKLLKFQTTISDLCWTLENSQSPRQIPVGELFAQDLEDAWVHLNKYTPGNIHKMRKVMF